MHLHVLGTLHGIGCILRKAVVDVPFNLQRVVEDSTTRCRLHGTSTTTFHSIHSYTYFTLTTRIRQKLSGLSLSVWAMWTGNKSKTVDRRQKISKLFCAFVQSLNAVRTTENSLVLSPILFTLSPTKQYKSTVLSSVKTTSGPLSVCSGGSRGCPGCPDTRPVDYGALFEKNIFSIYLF